MVSQVFDISKLLRPIFIINASYLIVLRICIYCTVSHFIILKICTSCIFDIVSNFILSSLKRETISPQSTTHEGYIFVNFSVFLFVAVNFFFVRKCGIPCLTVLPLDLHICPMVFPPCQCACYRVVALRMAGP